MRPGDVHATARDRGAFGALRTQRRWRFRQALVEDGEEALNAARPGILGIELLRAGEEDVAVGQIEGAGVAEMLVVAGQQPDRPGLEVDLVGVAEGLLDEQNALAVVREVGTLAEEGEPGDVRREVLVG